MGTYRNISINFWSDAKIDDNFSAMDKYVYLYLLTNPHTNICGCYELSKRQMAGETGLEWAELEPVIMRMQNEHQVLRYSPETKEILLVNWGRYNWSRSVKVQTAVHAVARYIKNQEFRAFVDQAIDDKIAGAAWMQDTYSSPDPDKKESTKEKTEKQKPENRKQTPENSLYLQKEPIPNPYPMDRVSEEDRGTDGVCVSEEDFESFWEAYPRAIRRQEAMEAFKSVTVPIETLLAAIEAQKESDAWQRNVIPSPAKWLNEGRWTDKVVKAGRQSADKKQKRKGVPPV